MGGVSPRITHASLFAQIKNRLKGKEQKEE